MESHSTHQTEPISIADVHLILLVSYVVKGNVGMKTVDWTGGETRKAGKSSMHGHMREHRRVQIISCVCRHRTYHVRRIDVL